jgi:hypothetical protein
MKFKTMYNTALSLTLLALSATSMASVSIDNDGVGFVGKGDVQQVFDWNNAQLQDNAASLQFRFGASNTASWTCAGENKAGKIVTTQHELTTGVHSAAAFDPRKNRQGQITGFILSGFDASQTSTQAAGQCPSNNGFVVQPALVGDINWNGSGEPTLQVSIDGNEWFDLPITY